MLPAGQGRRKSPSEASGSEHPAWPHRRHLTAVEVGSRSEPRGAGTGLTQRAGALVVAGPRPGVVRHVHHGPEACLRSAFQRKCLKGHLARHDRKTRLGEHTALAAPREQG